MVKSNFLKKFSKPLALLAILIILIIVLFSCVNNYSVENFTPKNNARVEVMLWTDDWGSIGNTFVTTEWLDIVNAYKGFPNITFGKGKATEVAKYVDVSKNPIYESWTSTDFRTMMPLVSTFLVVDTLKGQPALFAGATLTSAFIKRQIGTYFSRDYDKLFTNTPSNMPATPAVPAVPAAPTAPAAPAVPTETSSWLKLPGT